MQIHTDNQNYYVSLAKEFQYHLTKEHPKHGVMDQGKYKKLFTERKWKDRQYNVKDNADVTHHDVIMYCNTNQFPELSFCGLNSKPHGAMGLSKHYYLLFDPKLCHGICEILSIPCDCVACSSILDKPWISDIPPD